MRRSSGRLAEVVYIGADVFAYYETSNNLLLFLLVSLQKSLGLKFETEKRPVSPGYFKSLILVYLVRPKRRLIRNQKETELRLVFLIIKTFVST
jgi:hypothetical protein